MLIDAGPRDQRPARAVPDYGLIYRGEVLEEDLTIAGTVRVTLHVQSDCPDTDFVVKLIELLPDGRAMLLMDGVVRAMYRDGSAEPRPLVPDQVCRHVTSSNFPRRARNTNSGHPLLANDGEADIRIATNTVHHGDTAPSFIELPVLPAKSASG